MGLESRLFVAVEHGLEDDVSRPFAPERVGELWAALGEASLSGLLVLLGDELRDRSRAIAMAFADNELSRARYESSTLAVAALNIGAEGVGMAARRMEAAVALAQAGDRRAVAPALRRLRMSADETARALPHLAHDIAGSGRLAA